tara:strand:+ start:862 stop:1494 length:633 start_codon:yes stop_codon:yes gene_type:complete
MKISILCSSKTHPIYPSLKKWIKKQRTHNIKLLTDITKIRSGDILFLISFDKIVKSEIRSKFKKTLVIHASDLPAGRGWSPHIWQILDGKNKITVTLFEATDKIDSGNVCKKISFNLEGHELFDEINSKLFSTELKLMNFTIKNFKKLPSIPQSNTKTSVYPKRNPDDSELDPQKTIAEQFNLIRIADENRYPCFFYFKGQRYKLSIRKY